MGSFNKTIKIKAEVSAESQKHLLAELEEGLERIANIDNQTDEKIVFSNLKGGLAAFRETTGVVRLKAIDTGYQVSFSVDNRLSTVFWISAIVGFFVFCPVLIVNVILWMCNESFVKKAIDDFCRELRDDF